MRISIEDIKEHKYFQEVRWKELKERQWGDIPYKPNPMRFKYLLANQYETKTN